MPSRMERYGDVKLTRTSRNKDLYEQIYEDKTYSNVEGIVNTPENIDINKIKEIISKREENNRPQRRVKEPVFIETQDEEEKNYDIKDVLNKAKDERPSTGEYHSLKNVELDILKKLNINKQRQKENDEGIEELFNTITNSSMLQKLEDKELSLDLLNDLKSNDDNTVIGGSDAIRKVLKEEKKEEEEEMDKSFYTKSMNLSRELEGIEKKPKNKLASVYITISLIVMMLLLLFLVLKFVMHKI